MKRQQHKKRIAIIRKIALPVTLLILISLFGLGSFISLTSKGFDKPTNNELAKITAQKIISDNVTDLLSKPNQDIRTVLVTFEANGYVQFNPERFDLTKPEKLADNVYLFTIDPNATYTQIVGKINALDYVKYIEPDYNTGDLHAELKPTKAQTPDNSVKIDNSTLNLSNDPLSYLQRNLQDTVYSAYDLDIQNSWNNQGTTPIIVAVIDSKFKYTHEDIRFWKNVNEIPNNKIDDDHNGYIDDVYGPWMSSGPDAHGTWVSSIIAAKKDNAKGIAPICKTCQVMGLNVTIGMYEKPSEQTATVSMIIKAMEYAKANKARIINCSFELPYNSLALRDEVNKMEASGILIVAAAGNGGTNFVNSTIGAYPAMYPLVLAVGAANLNGFHSTVSNYGSWVDLWAVSQKILIANDYTGTPHYTLPLKDIWLYPTESYIISNQATTSFAAPQVSAVAGALLSKNPTLSPQSLRDILINGATKAPTGNNNRVNVILNAGKSQLLVR